MYFFLILPIMWKIRRQDHRFFEKRASTTMQNVTKKTSHRSKSDQDVHESEENLLIAQSSCLLNGTKITKAQICAIMHR